MELKRREAGSEVFAPNISRDTRRLKEDTRSRTSYLVSQCAIYYRTKFLSLIRTFFFYSSFFVGMNKTKEVEVGSWKVVGKGTVHMSSVS
jgi:hypothetical protein